MSDTDGTCEYVLDPDEPETWGGVEGEECHIRENLLNNNGVWECSHKKHNQKYFAFHSENASAEAEDEFIRIITDYDEGDQNENAEFLGANFQNIKVKTQSNIECDNIYLYYSEINGELDFSDLYVKNTEIDFTGAIFQDIVDFSDSIFKCELCFRHADFNDAIVYSGSEFYEKIDLKYSNISEISAKNATYDSKIDFSQSNFNRGAVFVGSRFSTVNYHNVNFSEEIIFQNVTFDGRAIFEKTKFNDTAVFTTAEFMSTASFNSADFLEDAIFKRVEFRGTAAFGRESSDLFTNNAKFGSNLDFSHTTFHSNADFSDIDPSGIPIFNHTKFNTGCDFSESNLIKGEFEQSDLTDSDFNDATLHEVNFESALLSRARVFEADLRGTKLSGAVLGDVRIDEDTKFLGHPSEDSDSSPHTLSAIRSRPTCVYDPDYEEDNEHEDVDKAKSVYRALEELGGKHARPRLQARCFVRRQDLQKKDYWDDATVDDASLEERFIASARWSRAKVARATLLYGESPWRVIAWSLGIIFSFALLYPLGGWMKPTDGDPITYAQIASNPVEIFNSVYYSTLTYTALGFGDFRPVSLGRLLTTVETGLGAVMLALLVFILGRRAAR